MSLCYEVLEDLHLLKAIDLYEEISKYDLQIFLKAMLAVEAKESVKWKPDLLGDYMIITAEILNLTKNKTINREMLLSSYLTAMIGANNIER